MISTRNLSDLPAIQQLNRTMKSLAVLDAIVEPDWEYRYYSFNSKWDTSEEMGSMRNGQGDAWFCVFSPVGAFLKGFDHESEMSPWNQEPMRVWPGVLGAVPEMFKRFVQEPAFSMDDTTFCIWRSAQESGWRTGAVEYPAGEDPDGSGWMLSILRGEPELYRSWAESYYERPVALQIVRHVYEHKPLTDEIIRTLNQDRDLHGLTADLDEIGYPS